MLIRSKNGASEINAFVGCQENLLLLAEKSAYLRIGAK